MRVYVCVCASACVSVCAERLCIRFMTSSLFRLGALRWSFLFLVHVRLEWNFVMLGQRNELVSSLGQPMTLVFLIYIKV